ncbi:MAG: DUF6326 family protein [Ornithinimicrobium sp.]
MTSVQSHITHEDPPSRSALADVQIPVQAKMAAAWTSFMFLYIYVDILNFFKPGVIDDIQGGLVFTFDISPALLTLFLVSVSIPALMAVLSVALPARVNRITNLVVATLYIPFSMFNAAGESLEWAAFYGLSIGLEVLLLAFILRSAWTWPCHTASPATRRDRTQHRRAQQT